MRFIIILLLAIVFVSVSGNSDDKTVRLTVGNWKPFTEQKGHSAGGIAVSVIEAAYREAGYRVKWGFFPWARAYTLGKIGDWDGSAVWYRSDERTEDFLYSNPVFTFREVLICHSDINPDWDKFEDLLSHRIGTVMFSEHPHIGSFLKAAGKPPQRFPTYKSLYNSLVSKRIDCTIMNPAAHEYFLYEIFPDQEINLNTAAKAFPPATVSLIISKNAANARELLQAFNRGLNAITSSGVYADIISRSPYFISELTIQP